jgi:hypothetical protein
MDAVNPQSVRPNGRADVRSHGQSVSDPGPYPVRDRTCPLPVRDRIRVRKLSVGSPCPRPWPRRECPRSGRRPSVNQPCPDTWTGRKMSASRFRISRVLSRQRLRHFPRESLIARLSPGDGVSPVVASMYCSPHQRLRSTLHSPPGSGSFASVILRLENYFAMMTANSRARRRTR